MYKCTVKTFTLFAVFIVFGTAAVSSIPSAAGIVILVIAGIVTPPGWLATIAFDFSDAFVNLGFVLTIQALAPVAVLELVTLSGNTTAIPAVPGTPGVVVFVVAEAIADEVL